MQSWKPVFLVLSIYFSHAVNQTIENAQLDYAKDNGNINKNISIPGITNKNGTTEMVLDDKNLHQNKTTEETQFKLNTIVYESQIVNVSGDTNKAKPESQNMNQTTNQTQSLQKNIAEEPTLEQLKYNKDEVAVIVEDQGSREKTQNRLQTIFNKNETHLGRNKEEGLFLQPHNGGNSKPNEETASKLKKFVNEYGTEKPFVVNPKAIRTKYSKDFNQKNIKNPNLKNDAIENVKIEAIKKELVTSIMNKTAALVIKLTKNRDPSDEEKARVLILIKEKILSNVSPLSERYKLWLDVITKGVDATFEKLRVLSGKVYRRSNNNKGTKVTKKVTLSKPFTKPPEKLNSILSNKCVIQIQRACTKIIGLNSLACDSGNKSVTMDKLCDGFYDCEDGSDEVKCSDKAIKKLKQAERMVEDAESSNFMDCFKYDESYLGLKKSDSLRKVIGRQISLIAHCIDSPLVKTSIGGQTRDRMILEQGSHQIATVISSVSLSLDGAICTKLIKNDDYDIIIKRVDKHEDITVVIDKDHDEEWSHKSCQCSGKVCVIHPCHEHCKKVCNHKYSLGQMICRTFSKDTSISLNLICDGKIDCEDESDEKDCNEGNTYARFQGHEAFGRAEKHVEMKIHSKNYSPVRGKLFKLQTTVTQLQKLTANLAVNKKALKSARNKAFELLGSIYVDMLTHVKTFDETENIFNFLMSLHDELIRALTHSHTGNDRLIPTEDCSCRDTYCNIPFCPAYCVKACTVEPTFTTLTCKHQPDVKVDVNNICDGTHDCPLGDDEKMCHRDICRKHHFMLLHSRLKEIDTGKDQNLLSEILKTWQKKAITTARTAEVAVISNRENFKLVVKKILHDLVLAYSFTDEIKGDPQQLFNTFYNVSQKVVRLVDYCGTY